MVLAVQQEMILLTKVEKVYKVQVHIIFNLLLDLKEEKIPSLLNSMIILENVKAEIFLDQVNMTIVKHKQYKSKHLLIKLVQV